MALSIDTQDLINYPGTVKRVSVDMDSVVPVGYEGDEQFMLGVSTTAYSDNDLRTAIQDLYITYLKAGWCKSSGFAGSGGKFDVDSTHYKLQVKIDATVSGVANGYYEIELDYNIDDTPISGEAIAEDMEAKIRAISLDTADTGFSLSYTNASVKFEDSKFWIVSGSTGNYFTGSNRSSVRVRAASSMSCDEELGFDQNINTEELAALSIKETILNSAYTAGNPTAVIGTGSGAVDDDCFMITDGTNTDFFQAATVSGTTITLAQTVGNSYAAGSRIQILQEQDPDGEPLSYYSSVDEVVRFGIKTMISQIDYSS